MVSAFAEKPTLRPRRAEKTPKKKKRKPSVRSRILDYFLDHVGETLDNRDLRRRFGLKADSWTRRVRELRAAGYSIVTHHDRAGLRPGQYMLADEKRKPSFDRSIPKKTRAFILERDGYTCQKCGVAAGETHPFDGRPVRLHIGHILDKSVGGSDDPHNLRAECSICNEGAGNAAPARPSMLQLLTTLRRAGRSDQQAAYEWLKQRFEK